MIKLSKMQVLRGWESHYGSLSAPLTTKFLVHPALPEICEFPGGLIFTLLRRNKKLDTLLKDLRASITAWETNEDSFRGKVYLPEVERRPIFQDPSWRSYPLFSTGQSTLDYWNDYFYDDDGPFEKTKATLYEDDIFGDGYREGNL